MVLVWQFMHLMYLARVLETEEGGPQKGTPDGEIGTRIETVVNVVTVLLGVAGAVCSARSPEGAVHGLGCRQQHTPSLRVGRDRRKQVDLGPESELVERALQLNLNTPQRP